MLCTLPSVCVCVFGLCLHYVLPFFLFLQQPVSVGGPPPPGSAPPTGPAPFKQMSVPETLDRVKEEFGLLQSQNQRYIVCDYFYSVLWFLIALCIVPIGMLDVFMLYT